MAKEEIFKKYEDVKLKFDNYNKFNFTYKGFAKNGQIVYATIEADSNDVYNLSVQADTVETLNSLDISMVSVYENNELVVSWSE